MHEAQLRRQTVPEAPYGDDIELRQRITVLPLVGTCGTLASNTSRRKNFVHHPKRVLRMSKNTWLRCTSTRRGSTMPREGSCPAFSRPSTCHRDSLRCARLLLPKKWKLLATFSSKSALENEGRRIQCGRLARSRGES